MVTPLWVTAANASLVILSRRLCLKEVAAARLSLWPHRRANM
jgi:hypothetical protein